MSASQRHNVSELVRPDRVHGSVYTDPEVFELELARIFARTWVYVAHESEVAEPGFYKTARIGRQPVIVSRGADDGLLRVFFNRCRHRAALVCQDEAGNANYFRCPYHGWTFASDGQLVGVPFRKGYGDDFDFADYPLLQVARVGSYRGFVFASLDPDVPELTDHLANALPYLDRLADSGPDGLVVRSGVQRYGYDGNWKMQLENAVDNYHVSFVHQSFVDIIAQQTGTRGRWHDGYCRDLGNGQGLLEFPPTGPPATGGEPFNLVIFPNFAWVGTQIRIVTPVAVNRSLVEVYPTLLAGVPDDVNEKRLRIHEQSFGPAGFVAPDDVEVAFNRVHEGLQAVGGDQWLYLKRGLGRHEVDGETGVRTSHITDEMGQQAIYRQWSRLMTEEA